MSFSTSVSMCCAGNECAGKKMACLFLPIMHNECAPGKGCYSTPPLARATPGALFLPPMKLFYLDESGNPELTGISDSYVLVAVSIPIHKWTACDKAVNQLKASYGLLNAEIHTAWMLRSYHEQQEIAGFEEMNSAERRAAVTRVREQKVESYKANKSAAALKSLKKIYKNTDAYIHLTQAERRRFIYELVAKIKGWSFVRLFAEIIDKTNYHPPKPNLTPESQAFERIVTRIETYLSHISRDEREYGLLIHDECESVTIPHVNNMRRFYRRGTFKSAVKHIIETPLFVSSSHTNMVQLADVCAYAIRRYYDSGESELYTPLKARADRVGADIVGFNHYTADKHCPCELCEARRKRQS